MIFEKMTTNLTPEQMTIFNRVMKTSFYLPIAAYRHEPKNRYYQMDAIEPAKDASFYTEYFLSLHDYYDEGTDIHEYISASNLTDFISQVVQCILRLGPMQESDLLDQAASFAEMERAHFEEYRTTLEEHHSLLGPTKMVSQLKRYLEAYGERLYFQYDYFA